MRELLILRHGKSEPSDAQEVDKDRDLIEAGRNAALACGKALAEKELIPALILSSPALRASKTAHLVATHSGYGGNVLLSDDLYPGSPETIRRVASSIAEAEPEPAVQGREAKIIMLVGHNPAIENFLEETTGKKHEMHAGDLAHLEYDINEWTELTNETPGELIDIIHA